MPMMMLTFLIDYNRLVLLIKINKLIIFDIFFKFQILIIEYPYFLDHSKIALLQRVQRFISNLNRISKLN